MNDKLKGHVDSVVALARSIGESRSIPDYDREMLMDLTKYMMFLSASDGIIAPEEAEAIKNYTGVDYTPEQVKEFLDRYKIYSVDFEHRVPESVKKLVEIVNDLRRSDNPPEEDASEVLLALYKEIGNELVGSDGDVDIREETDMYIYLTTIDKYLADNLISREKDREGKMAVTVPAPKKK